ncbi:MAG: STAS domain-containing protein [Candidatus Omnitrophica bacterium]|nr:STAS domain-containing protein [Candidatus Omnitrophota bacterium]
MQIKHEKRNGAIICRIEGQININTSEALSVFFDNFAGFSGQKVLLNFSKVEYIDSMGMATVIKIHKKCLASGSSLVLSDVPPKIGSIFKITKVDRVFSIFPTEQEALNSFIKA